MAIDDISELPDPPTRGDAEDQFVTKANAFLGALVPFRDQLNTFAGQANNLADTWESTIDQAAIDAAASATQQAGTFANEAEGHADDAEASANLSQAGAVTAQNAAGSAVSAGNYKGDWVDLTGSLSTPASVSHEGYIWALKSNLGDVTANEPGSGSVWAKITPTAPNLLTSLPDITALSSLNTDALVDGQAFNRLEFWPDTNVGGVQIKWDANRPTADHNGGTIIDPRRVSELNPETKEFNDYFTPVAGNLGCFVSSDPVVKLSQFGGVRNQIIDSSAAIVAWGTIEGVQWLDGAYSHDSDIDVTGFNLRGLTEDAELIAMSGANVLSLSGSSATFKARGVKFSDYPRSAVWLTDSTVCEEIDVQECEFANCRIALSYEPDPALGNYGIDKYNVQNENSRIEKLVFKNNEVYGGKAAIAYTIVVRNYEVTGNDVHDLSNSDTGGSSNENGVFGFRIFVDGLEREASGKYNDLYDESYNGIVSNNNIRRLAQLAANDKPVNAILAGGFSVVISGNVIRDVSNAHTGDPSDCEGIYAKSAECNVCDNSLHNAGSNQAGIAVKGIDVSVETVPGGSSAGSPGRSRIVANNNLFWDITPENGIWGIEVQSSPCVIEGNIIRGITQQAVRIQGEITDGYNFQSILIQGNYVEGAHNEFCIARGGINGVTIIGNTNIVNGGSGDCSFFNISQSRGDAYDNILVSKNTHRIRGRTSIPNYNAAIRLGINEYPVRNIIVENNIFDHAIDGAPNKGWFIQGDAPLGSVITGLKSKGNTWPTDLFDEIFDIGDAFPVEYEIEEDTINTTSDDTEIYFLNSRVNDDATLSLEVVSFGRDSTAGESAKYHKSGLFSRADGGFSRIGSEAVLVEVAQDASWDVSTDAVGNRARISVIGDATNPVRWKSLIKAKVSLN